MKKIVMVLIALTMTLAANAQFEAGKWYGNASLSGLDLSYNGAQELRLGLEGKGGYLFDDDWMVLGNLGIDTQKDFTAFTVGAGIRYYIEQNGIYLGANLNYKHSTGSYNDVMPGIEIGYAFFINRYCTIEPAIYYNQSTQSHKDFSTVGFRIGIGIYM